MWFGRDPKDLPYRKLAVLDSEIFAAYTGPEDGLCLVHDLQNDAESKHSNVQLFFSLSSHYLLDTARSVLDIAPIYVILVIHTVNVIICALASTVCGSHTWAEKKNRKAYGISTSLYDQHPVKKTISGE